MREFWRQNREFSTVNLEVAPSLWDFILDVVQPEPGAAVFDIDPTQFAEAHRRWVASGDAQKPYSGWGR